MRIHLDTDLGGDPDDVCALALLLRSPDAEITGITTVLDGDGQRTAYTSHVLELAERSGVPVIAGAGGTLTGNQARPDGVWPDLPPLPAAPGAALDLLAASVAQGATIIAIGPLTNLGLLETVRPGTLAAADVVAMGGHLGPPAEGLPQWGPEMDWNIQFDTRAARIVAAATGHLTLVTLPATMSAWLRAEEAPRLRTAGPLGELLAEQSRAHAEAAGFPELGRTHPGLPDDLLNFHYDPVTVAVALGWPVFEQREMRLETQLDQDVLRFAPSSQGRATWVVTEVDGTAFSRRWLSTISPG